MKISQGTWAVIYMVVPVILMAALVCFLVQHPEIGSEPGLYMERQVLGK